MSKKDFNLQAIKNEVKEKQKEEKMKTTKWYNGSKAMTVYTIVGTLVVVALVALYTMFVWGLATENQKQLDKQLADAVEAVKIESKDQQ